MSEVTLNERAPEGAQSSVRRRIRLLNHPNGEPATGALPTARGAAARQTTRLTAAVERAAALGEPVFDAQDVSISYAGKRALAGVSLPIYRNRITAIIGPSGCGKTTFLRSLNRMNDSVPGFRIEGRILYHGHDLYARDADRVEVRRRIGMVFQRPNPFPKSIFQNVAWAPRNLGMRARLDERVERALRAAALWDEVKDRLGESALSLSGGQQQRLCIARAIAIEPDVLLLDEPASALDPTATLSIEELMQSLKRRYTIVIVTHNMQQAARVADRTAFFSLGQAGGAPAGVLVEYDDTDKLFTQPRDRRTSDYVTGRFG
jgi:phosphate transport system ATP-binding protein